MINFLQSIHSCVMWMNIDMGISYIRNFMCFVSEPVATSGLGLLLARDTGTQVTVTLNLTVV